MRIQHTKVLFSYEESLASYHNSIKLTRGKFRLQMFSTFLPKF